MIKTREDLKFYLQEDAKANRMEGCSLLKYCFRLFIGSEAAHVYKYLKVLRHQSFRRGETHNWKLCRFWPRSKSPWKDKDRR